MSRSNSTPPPNGFPPHPGQRQPAPREAAPQWQGGPDPYAPFHNDAAAWSTQPPPAPTYAPAPAPHMQPHPVQPHPAQPYPAHDPRLYADQAPPPFDPRAYAPHPSAFVPREPRPLDLADFAMPGAAPSVGSPPAHPNGYEFGGQTPVDHRFIAGHYDQHDARGYAEPALPPGYPGAQAYAPAPDYGQPHGHSGSFAPALNAPYGAPAAAAAAPETYDDEEEFEDEEPPRRGGRFMIAAALVGAIGLGGGLAYAYKMFAGSGSKTPLIKADATPTKSKAPTSPGGKVNERLGDNVASANDSDVTRTRQVPTQSISAAPPTSTPPPPAATTAMPGLVLDNSAMVPRPLPPVVPAAPPSSGPAPVTTSPARPTLPSTAGSGPVPVNPRVVAIAPPAPAIPSAAVAERAPAPKPPSKTPVPKASDAFKPSTTGGVAAVASTTASTTPSASASGLGSSGNGFVAVIASQKSRIDAMKVFADIQQKYPNVLGGRAAEVQEVNLGEAKGGIWFRAVVGPPGSRQAAAKVCADLRAAGMPDKQCWATAY